MKKNIYNDEETFFKWVEQLDTSKKAGAITVICLIKSLKPIFQNIPLKSLFTVEQLLNGLWVLSAPQPYVYAFQHQYAPIL